MNRTSVSSFSIDLSIQSISLSSDLPFKSIYRYWFLSIYYSGLTGNKKQLCTFLSLFCTTRTWNFQGSHFMEKQCRMCLPKILLLVLLLSQFQAVPVPPGHLSFCFGKAASAPGGAGRSYKNPTVGLENETKRKAKKREALHTNCP